MKKLSSVPPHIVQALDRKHAARDAIPDAECILCGFRFWSADSPSRQAICRACIPLHGTPRKRTGQSRAQREATGDKQKAFWLTREDRVRLAYLARAWERSEVDAIREALRLAHAQESKRR